MLFTSIPPDPLIDPLLAVAGLLLWSILGAGMAAFALRGVSFNILGGGAFFILSWTGLGFTWGIISLWVALAPVPLVIAGILWATIRRSDRDCANIRRSENETT